MRTRSLISSVFQSLLVGCINIDPKLESVKGLPGTANTRGNYLGIPPLVQNSDLVSTLRPVVCLFVRCLRICNGKLNPNSYSQKCLYPLYGANQESEQSTIKLY